MTRFTILCRGAALCSTGAAIIHFGVAPGHFDEWVIYGVFFLLVAAFQLGWAFLTWTVPDARLHAAGLAVNAAVVVLWAVTRTVGLPLGPEPWRPEQVGVTDLVCTALELLVAVACTWLLLARHDPVPGVVTRRVGIGVVGALAAATLAVSGVALAMPSDEHATAAEHGTDPGQGGGGHDHHSSTNGERHRLPNLPDVSHATPAQTAAAGKLLDESIAGTAKYRDAETAKAAGYDVDAALRRWQRRHPNAMTGKVVPVLHVGNPTLRDDGRQADPTAPESLIYHRDADGRLRLIGVLYLMPRGEEGPDLAGPYTRWHFHARGGRESAEMMHVWFVRDQDLRYAYALAPPRRQIAAYQATLH